ncbi:MAG: diguanylate cyclase [Eubacteriales bacterium]
MMRTIKPNRTKQAGDQSKEGVVFNSLPVGLLVFDEEACLVNVNNHFFKTFNMAPTDPEGQRFGKLFRCKHALGRGKACGTTPACPTCPLMENVNKVLETGESITDLQISMDVEIDGRISSQWFLVNLSRVVEARQTYVLAAFTDITEKRLAEHELSTLGVSDELTGLYTRRYLLKKLDELIHLDWPEAFPLAIAMMEIDSDKLADVMQDEGSEDDIRKSMAEILKEHTRSTDFIGRYGENEFMAVFTNTNAEVVQGIIKNMMTAFGEKTKTKIGRQGTFSTGLISVGSVAGSICDIKDYIHDTEALLQKAKLNGCNRIEEEKEAYS